MPVSRAHVQMTRNGNGRVTLDGVTIPGVRTVEVRNERGSLPRVVLEIIAREAPVEYVDRLDDDQEVSPDAAPR
ncbi:hypothetical protein NGM36_13130 [Streptomyces mutabilis]|uniref:hypothetical protein n=1 Tax=Streptomyces mutabilis TaxID=67332 RepID=UPI0022BA6CAF|nr:hypothetical protein [Streptomyces mutabilis]MCZ9350730.1 hypothetical protein [Streptomyces mutabilis]